MLEATLLLAVPLCLRWYTAHSMRRLGAAARKREEQVVRLQAELDELLSASREVGQVARRCSMRRSLLDQEINHSHQVLEGLRSPTPPEKMAA